MIRRLVLPLTFLMLAAMLLAAPSRAQPYDAGEALVELISERSTAVPGETVYLALDFTIDPHWHVYWRNAGDAGLAPQILWDEGPVGDVTRDDGFLWPLPKLLPVVEGEIMNYGYEEVLTLPFAFTVPEEASGPIRFSGTADYQICKDVCLTQTAPVSFTLDVGPTQQPDTRGAIRIAAALDDVPRAFHGEAAASADDGRLKLSLAPAEPGLLDDARLRFIPEGHEIVHAADQRLTAGPQGVTLDMMAQPRNPLDGSLEGVVMVSPASGEAFGISVDAVAAGAPLPGTFGTPVAAPSATGAAAGVGLLALIGLVVMGGLVLNLMPCVLPVLSIKAMGMVETASRGEANALRAHGLFYTAGVLAAFAALAAAFVALRSVGEFWALGALLQYPVVVAALALGAFLLGLWLLGSFELGGSLQNVGHKAASRGGNAGAFATGALAATAGAPCVGPFIGVPLGAALDRSAWEVFALYLALGFGLALPFLLLSFAPGLSRFLPKPGPWMERVKQFFAFPMFLTAAGLLVVLGDQAGTGAVGWLVAGAGLIAFGIWAVKTAGGRVRPAALGLGGIALAAGLAVPIVAAAGSSPPEARADATAYAARYPTEPWSPARVDELLAEGRGVFVDFTATWCMICQANKRTTLTRPEVLEAMEAANITFLVADFTTKDPLIADELQRRGRPGVPMYLLWGPGEAEPKLLPSALTPQLMLREIDAVASSS